MITFFQSSGYFLFWCSVMLFSIGMACILVRARGVYKLLNQPVITPFQLELLRAKYRDQSK